MEYMDGSHFLWIGVRLILPLLVCRIEPPAASQSCGLHCMHAMMEQSRKGGHPDVQTENETYAE